MADTEDAPSRAADLLGEQAAKMMNEALLAMFLHPAPRTDKHSLDRAAAAARRAENERAHG